MKKSKECCANNTNDFVKLAGTLGGIFLVIVILFLVLSKEQVVFAVSIAWSFAILGIVLGFFMYLAKKSRK